MTAATVRRRPAASDSTRRRGHDHRRGDRAGGDASGQRSRPARAGRRPRRPARARQRAAVSGRSARTSSARARPARRTGAEQRRQRQPRAGRAAVRSSRASRLLARRHCRRAGGRRVPVGAGLAASPARGTSPEDGSRARDDRRRRACRSVSAMEPTIEVARPAQALRRRRVAVDGLTFTVRPGEVTGFVGPNGAGQVHHDADDPRPGRAPTRDARSSAAGRTGRCAHPLRAGRRAARRGRAAPRPPRPRPPAVAGPQQRPAARAGSTRCSTRSGLDRRRPGGGPAASRSACGSGSASPPRCSATRRC